MGVVGAMHMMDMQFAGLTRLVLAGAMGHAPTGGGAARHTVANSSTTPGHNGGSFS
jgi:hypothetical protein